MAVDVGDGVTTYLGDLGRALPEAEQQDIRLSRIGGLPVWSQWRPRQLDPGCELCGGRLVLVGQFSAGYGSTPKRLLHVFACPSKCSSDSRADTQPAWRILRTVGPRHEDMQDETARASQGVPADTLAAAERPSDMDDWAAAPTTILADDDDWGAAPSAGLATAVATDAEIEGLLQLRESSAMAAAPAAASTSSSGRPARSGPGDQGDAWLGFTDASSSSEGHVIPCHAVEIYAEPLADSKSGEHEKELYEHYLQSGFADDDGGEGKMDVERHLPPEAADELSLEEARMKAEMEDDEADFGADDDDEDDTAAPWLAKFQRRLERSPRQVVRYAWGGSALWINSPPREVLAHTWPPCCKHCGSERIFELQLLPTLLTELRPRIPGLEMEWGTVIVYTCAEDCSTDGASEEFVVVQAGE